MKNPKFLSSSAAILVLTQSFTHANEVTWNGGAGGSWDWSQASNWVGGAAPETNNNSILHFAGDGSPTGGNSWNNLGWWNTHHQIIFDAGAASFNLQGDEVTLSPNGSSPSQIVNNSSSGQTINFWALACRGATITAATAGIRFTNNISPLWIDPSSLGSSLTINGGANHAVVFECVVTDGGGANGILVLDADNTLKLSGANTYSGGTTLNAGLVEAQNSQAFGSGSVRVNVGAWVSAQADVQIASGMDLNGGTLGWHYTSGNGKYTGPVTLNATSTVSLANHYGFGSVKGTISGIISGSGGLIVNDLDRSGNSSPGGTLFLIGANTYLGTTEINGGNVIVDGSTDAASNVVLNSGVLGGNGTVGGPVAVSATASVAPGSPFSIGTLSFGTGLAFTSGGKVLADINTDFTTADQLAITGNLDITGAPLIVSNLGSGDPGSGAVFTIGTYTGTLAGTFDGLPEGAELTISGKPYTIRYADGGKNITLTAPVTATPFESWALANITAVDPGANAAPEGDPDNDGASNLSEFAFNGSPLSGSNRGTSQVYTEDSSADVESANQELILTIAVRKTSPVAPAFSGSPLSLTVAGVTYTIQGGVDLTTFNTAVNEVTPITTGLPDLSGNADYDYRSFSLDGTNGLVGKGFLRAKVSN